MKPATFEQAIDELIIQIEHKLKNENYARELLKDLRKILIAKQFDYGHGNILKFGEFGVLVRVNDKIERLKTLIAKNKNPKNESIDDSWLDMINYGIIAMMLRKGTFTLPLKSRKRK